VEEQLVVWAKVLKIDNGSLSGSAAMLLLLVYRSSFVVLHLVSLIFKGDFIADRRDDISFSLFSEHHSANLITETSISVANGLQELFPHEVAGSIGPLSDVQGVGTILEAFVDCGSLLSQGLKSIQVDAADHCAASLEQLDPCIFLHILIHVLEHIVDVDPPFRKGFGPGTAEAEQEEPHQVGRCQGVSPAAVQGSEHHADAGMGGDVPSGSIGATIRVGRKGEASPGLCLHGDLHSGW